MQKCTIAAARCFTVAALPKAVHLLLQSEAQGRCHLAVDSQSPRLPNNPTCSSSAQTHALSTTHAQSSLGHEHSGQHSGQHSSQHFREHSGQRSRQHSGQHFIQALESDNMEWTEIVARCER